MKNKIIFLAKTLQEHKDREPYSLTEVFYFWVIYLNIYLHGVSSATNNHRSGNKS